MRKTNAPWLAAAAILGLLIITQPISSAASQGRGPTPSTKGPQQPGSVTGTLTVGSWKLQLSHAYAFQETDETDPAKHNYRIFVTNQPFTASALKLVAANNEGDRQQLLVELSDHKIYGLEIVVSADTSVQRATIHTPELALGMMLLEPTQFQAAALDSRRIAGKVFTETPIHHIRINKSIQYEATFSASITGPTSK